MIYCQICGDCCGVKYYATKRQYLCKACAKDTPAKVSRESFERLYWGKGSADVSEFQKREFYSDYLASSYTVAEYRKATVFEVM